MRNSEGRLKDRAITAVCLSVILVLLCILGVSLGSVRISFSDVAKAVFSPSSLKPNTAYIIRNLRLPRVVCALAAGSALAVCGLIFQSVFRNPMADSYVLGISSGASFFVTAALALGLCSSTSMNVPAFAFIGAALTCAVLFMVSGSSTLTLLLTGMAMNFLLSALTQLMIYLGKGQLDNILYWTLGNLSSASWSRVILMLISATLIVIFTFSQRDSMDMLLMDESTAYSSGLNVRRERLVLLLAASIATSVVVSFCGVIGFVGLMCPHIIRLVCGPKHRTLIPLSALLGADVLLLSDLICRTVAPPTELPVGIVTSILGAPILITMLRRKKNG